MPYAIVYPRTSLQRDVTVIGPYPVPVGDWLTGIVRSMKVIVGANPTPLPANPLINRRYLDIYNNSPVTIYLGGAGLTPGEGRPLASGASYPINLDSKAIMYAVEVSGSREVRIMEGN